MAKNTSPFTVAMLVAFDTPPAIQPYLKYEFNLPGPTQSDKRIFFLLCLNKIKVSRDFCLAEMK
jgi:hypothetical protein